MSFTGVVVSRDERDAEGDGEARKTGEGERKEISETPSAGRAALHPWRCKLGHENRTSIPPESREGSRRRLVLWCSEPGCAEHTAVFAGASNAPPVFAGASNAPPVLPGARARRRRKAVAKPKT
jgi:hypothetical protein